MQLADVNINTEWQLAKSFPTLGELVSSFLPKALVIGGIIFFVMVLVAGFNVLGSAGSDDAAQKAKWHQVLTYAAVGLIIMFGAFWILQIINFITKGSLDALLGTKTL